jgi:hypothetical protein|tara:strand:+ start:212 stop:397 length:186 start_codon:yes stop_codon:yes gene_type:complete
VKVGDLVKWTGKLPGDTGCVIGLVEGVCDKYIYIRWADGELDEYEVDGWQRLDLEVINEAR